MSSTNEIIEIYLENLTQRAARLGVARDTLYKWRGKPSSADMNLIEQDVREMLRLIMEARVEKETT